MLFLFLCPWTHASSVESKSEAVREGRSSRKKRRNECNFHWSGESIQIAGHLWKHNFSSLSNNGMGGEKLETSGCRKNMDGANEKRTSGCWWLDSCCWIIQCLDWHEMLDRWQGWVQGNIWSLCNLLHPTHVHSQRDADTTFFRTQCSGSWQDCFRPTCPLSWCAAPASLRGPEVQSCSFSSSMGLSLKLRGETQNPRYLFYVFQTKTTNSAAHSQRIHTHLLWWFGTLSFYCVTHYIYI